MQSGLSFSLHVSRCNCLQCRMIRSLQPSNTFQPILVTLCLFGCRNGFSVNPIAIILIFGYNVSCEIVFGGGVPMKGYISAREASYKWGISESRVHKLCQTGRIPGLERFGRSWVIPEDAEKPQDPRTFKNIFARTEESK